VDRLTAEILQVYAFFCGVSSWELLNRLPGLLELTSLAGSPRLGVASGLSPLFEHILAMLA
jgi:hypothetical protein